MAFLTTLTMVGFVTKKDLPIDDEVENRNSILSVDEHFCIGCGLCTRVSSDNFVLLNKKAKVTKKIFKYEEDEKINYI